MQNFGNIMKQAKKMQERMMELQEELAGKTVEATAGGGMVAVTVNGKFEVLSLRIEKEVVNPEDVEKAVLIFQNLGVPEGFHSFQKRNFPDAYGRI